MYRKIDVYINGVYEYSTNKFKKCKDAVKEARNIRHIEIASIPNRYITIHNNDKIVAKFT